MIGNRLRKYAGIITLLLFLVAFIPSALSQSERNPEGDISSHRTGQASSDPAAGGTAGGTIAMGTAIAKAAVVAVAVSPSNATVATSH